MREADLRDLLPPGYKSPEEIQARRGDAGGGGGGGDDDDDDARGLDDVPEEADRQIPPEEHDPEIAQMLKEQADFYVKEEHPAATASRMPAGSTTRYVGLSRQTKPKRRNELAEAGGNAGGGTLV